MPGAAPQTITIANTEIYLDNIYRQVRSLPPGQRDDEIVSFVEKGLAEHETSKQDAGFAAASERVRLQIAPDDYLGQARDLVHREFLAGLMIAYAIDENDRYELVRQPVIDSWHVEQPEIETRAIANLEAVSTDIPLERNVGTGGGAFVAVSTSDGYDAARLLPPQFMNRVRQALNASSVFVGIPNRDFLVARTSDFAPRRAFVTKITQDFQRRPHPLTDALFAASEIGVRLADAAEMRDHGR